MRKSILIKLLQLLIIIGLGIWIWFCAKKVPEFQEANRKAFAADYIAASIEHEQNYVDILDTEGRIHSIPINQYNAEHVEFESIEVPICKKAPAEIETNVISMAQENEVTTEAVVEEDGYTRYTLYSKDYTEEDVDLLARLVQSEAGIESYECKLMVASVVVNRCEYKGEFPDNLYDVIFQRTSKGVAQFSVTRTKKDGTRAIDGKPSKKSIKAARDILENGTIIPIDVQFFYSTSCDSTWLATRETYKTIDHTIFAYRWRKE